MGASKRSEAQVRKLNRQNIDNGAMGGFTSEIRKDGLASSGAALDYEKQVGDLYRRFFGDSLLPGNLEHLRGRRGR